jgi:hypothetical protein
MRSPFGINAGYQSDAGRSASWSVATPIGAKAHLLVRTAQSFGIPWHVLAV